jgi:hypothetical protein
MLVNAAAIGKTVNFRMARDALTSPGCWSEPLQPPVPGQCGLLPDGYPSSDANLRGAAFSSAITFGVPQRLLAKAQRTVDGSEVQDYGL